MFLDKNRSIRYSCLEIIYQNYIFWDFHDRSYHCTTVGAIWNLSKFTGSTGKFSYSIFLESRSILGAKFSGAYNTSTGASKYFKIVKIHYPPNLQNFPKLCITFKKHPLYHLHPLCSLWFRMNTKPFFFCMPNLLAIGQTRQSQPHKINTIPQIIMAIKFTHDSI